MKLYHIIYNTILYLSVPVKISFNKCYLAPICVEWFPLWLSHPAVETFPTLNMTDYLVYLACILDYLCTRALSYYYILARFYKAHSQLHATWAVVLDDWKTYADMKSLAVEKLRLELMDSFLPIGSLDQGLDILQIMRNIHIFVSRNGVNLFKFD